MIRRALAVATLLLAAPAGAAVTFNTTASQMCIGAPGCGVNTQTFGGMLTVSFIPVSGGTVSGSPPSNAVLGQIVVSCVGGGAACGSFSLAGLNLYINVSQTAPSAGNGSIPGGAFSGTISGVASNASVAWSTTTATIGTVTYTVLSNPAALVPPSSFSGTITILGRVADAPPPALQGRASRKAQGGTSFDLPLAP